MGRSPSPERHFYKSSDRDKERRKSRSPRPSRDERDVGESGADDKGKARDDDRRSKPRDDDRDARRDRDRDRRDEKRRSRSRSPHRSSRRGRDRDRSRSRSIDRDSGRDRHRSSRRRSRSVSSSGSSSGASDDSRRRRHKSSSHRSSHGRRHRDRDDDRDRDHQGRDKEERRRRREEKKARKEKRERKKLGLTQKVEWGKYGLIAEPDIYTKTNEFYAWLIGERMINPETLPKSKEKDEFKVYMEAYNTGTLPEKYVDIGKHEAKMAAIRSGETVVNDDRYDPNKDLEAVRAANRRAPAQTETFLDREKLAELRKVQQDRVTRQVMTSLGLKTELTSSMGVRFDQK